MPTNIANLLKNIDISDGEPTDTTIGGIRYAMKHIIRLGKELLKLTEDDTERKQYVDELEEQMLKLVRSEVNYLESGKIVDATVEEMPEIPGGEALKQPNAAELLESADVLKACDDIAHKSQAKMKAFNEGLRDQDLKKHPIFKELQKELNSVENEVDTDIGSSEDEGTDLDESAMDLENPSSSRGKKAEEMIPIFDPITKQPLTDPIRNSICNHIYGKAAMLELIKGKKIRCPQIGCSNKEFIQKEHLQEDPDLLKKVKKQQKQANNRRIATQQEEDRDRGTIMDDSILIGSSPATSPRRSSRRSK